MPSNVLPQLVMLSEPASTRAEAFRVLRARLEQAPPQRLSSLLLTSPSAREQRHLVAANLALAFAEAGSPLALIDADLHHPQLHSLFSLAEAPGLRQCLESDSNASLQPGPLPSLSLLVAGGTYPVPAQLLSSKAMDSLLATLSTQERLVILVAPPVLPVADATLLASKVGGVVLLSAANRTTRSALREAKSRLEGVRANILGAVLDGVSDAINGKY
ncbi:MAG: CpsD/CapB family tyrosine-protein kinase [Anaerolineae bacterium]